MQIILNSGFLSTLSNWLIHLKFFKKNTIFNDSLVVLNRTLPTILQRLAIIYFISYFNDNDLNEKVASLKMW